MRPMTLPARDPKDFLVQELARLEGRYQRLTGLDYKRVMSEDSASQGAATVAPLDIRNKVGLLVCIDANFEVHRVTQTLIF